MLIIARRKGQKIAIGHDVQIIVTDLSRSFVKLGIIAPPERTILRSEVREAIEEANRQAALSKIDDPSSLIQSSEEASQDTPTEDQTSGSAER